MSEKFFVTTYDLDEIIFLIREALHEEITECLNQQEKEKDYDLLLSRREVAQL